MSFSNGTELEMQILEQQLFKACKNIPPWWELDNMVAVNPFLEMSHLSLKEVNEYFTAATQKSVLPNWRVLAHAYQGGEFDWNLLTELGKKLGTDSNNQKEILAICKTNLESKAAYIPFEKTKGNRIPLYRPHFSAFLASHFDQGFTRMPWKSSGGLYQSWREWALYDRLPERLGVKNFREHVKQLPTEALATRKWLSNLYGQSLKDTFFDRLLLEFPGWSGWIRKQGWEISPTEVGDLPELVTALWACEFICYPAEIRKYQNGQHVEESTLGLSGEWENAAKILSLKAWEKSYQTQIHRKMIKANSGAQVILITPEVQAVFCIDVRSEPFRKTLEEKIPNSETYGFAGFFAMPFAVVNTDQSINQCPVLLKPAADWKAPVKINSSRTALLSSFRRSALGGFSFMELFGWQKAFSLFQGAFPAKKKVLDPTSNEIEKGLIHLSLEAKVELVKGMLFYLGLSKPYAKLIVLCGHESSVENNPQAGGLACGACGGHSGGINAQLAAHLLNDKKVRSALGDLAPSQESFALAAVHDTCLDTLKILNVDAVPVSHQIALQDFIVAANHAGHQARINRVKKIPGLDTLPLENISESLLLKKFTARSQDWAETRPEWGLADCASFIVAPREWTKNLDLEGRSFLHSYDSTQDPEAKTLGLILTAPLVVASWISLQYYASTTLPDIFGSGDKCLYTVIAGLGVAEGLSGDIRSGLAMQSIADGEKLRHRPQRLQVFVADQRERVQKVLDGHAHLRELFENEWLALIVMEGSPENAWRKSHGSDWEKII